MNEQDGWDDHDEPVLRDDVIMTGLKRDFEDYLRANLMSPPSLALIHEGALLGNNSSAWEGALHSASRLGGANGPKRHW